MVETSSFMEYEIICLYGNEAAVTLCPNIMSDASFPGHRFVRRTILISKGCKANLKTRFLCQM
jgi:hypothetical protein